MKNAPRYELRAFSKEHSKLEHSRWRRAAPLLEHPWAIRMTMVWIAVSALAAAVSWWLLVPVTDWLAHHDVGSASGSILQTARDAARGRLLTLGAGLFAAGVLIYTAKTFALSRQGQLTNRYTQATEQLGSDKLDVRIAGIYALERLARDSKRDHPAVMEMLAAFVRVHAGKTQQAVADHQQQARPEADVQAALTVIGRRLPFRDILGRPIDLTYADLTRAKLVGADLVGVDLVGADFTDAILTAARWPKDAPVPKDWQRDTVSGRLVAVDTTGV